MDILQTIQGYVVRLAPTAAALVGVFLVLAVSQRILERRRLRAGSPRVVSQLIMVVLSLAGLMVILMGPSRTRRAGSSTRCWGCW